MARTKDKIYTIVDTMFQGVRGMQDSLKGYGYTPPQEYDDDVVDNMIDYNVKANYVSKCYTRIYNFALSLSRENNKLMQENKRLKQELEMLSQKPKGGRKQLFTDEEKAEIIKEYNRGGKSIRELAKKYCCSVGTMGNIVQKR